MNVGKRVENGDVLFAILLVAKQKLQNQLKKTKSKLELVVLFSGSAPKSKFGAFLFFWQKIFFIY